MENVQKKAASSWIFWIYQKSSPLWKGTRSQGPKLYNAEEASKLTSCLNCPQKFKNQQGLCIAFTVNANMQGKFY